MNIESLKKRILSKFRMKINNLHSNINRKIIYNISRANAHKRRKQIIGQKDENVVNVQIKHKIKKYCKKRFGDASYWPWIALYCEIRGEYIEGWIPYDYYRFDLLPRLNPDKFIRLSETKTIDNYLFSDNIFKPLFIRLRGCYFNTEGLMISESKVQFIMNQIDDEVVIKPDEGRRGKGIIFKVGKELNLKSLPSDTDLVIQKLAKQHSILHDLYPHSINTFRVLTHLNQKGSIVVKFVTLRFGLDGSRVDNISSGGGWVPVHFDGTVCNTAYLDQELKTINRHPDTGFSFSDMKLPFFEKIISLCNRMHRSFPFVGVIGWDVYVNEAGEPKLIEWNANNPWFMNVEALIGPLWPNNTF